MHVLALIINDFPFISVFLVIILFALTFREREREGERVREEERKREKALNGFLHKIILNSIHSDINIFMFNLIIGMSHAHIYTQERALQNEKWKKERRMSSLYMTKFKYFYFKFQKY